GLWINIHSRSISFRTATLDYETRLYSMECQTVVEALLNHVYKSGYRLWRVLLEQADGDLSFDGVDNSNRIRRLRICSRPLRCLGRSLAGWCSFWSTICA